MILISLHHCDDIDLNVHILVGEVGHWDAGGGRPWRLKVGKTCMQVVFPDALIG
ncbi:hypothetical protein N9444_02555 [Gammaproteobacteria bacterium]|nr:hypothetical protein [Gammaproteobacteria bacterium]